MAITKLTVYPAVEVVNITIFYSDKSRLGKSTVIYR